MREEVNGQLDNIEGQVKGYFWTSCHLGPTIKTHKNPAHQQKWERLANIRKVGRKGNNGSRSNHAWEVRYRDPQRRDRSKTFRTKAEAEAFSDAVETDIARGHYLDPQLGKKTFGEWAQEWLEGREPEIKPTTLMSYRGLLDVHLLPFFGRTAMTRIRPLDVQRFLAKMANTGLSRSRLRQARQLLSMILNAAVDNGYIGRNPVPRERLKGKEPRRDQHPLTFEQVHAVANTVPDRYRALIYVLAYGGLRWGEAAALRRSCCNLLRNRLDVRESVAELGGGLHYGSPKTHQARTVVIPEPVKAILSEHLARYVNNTPAGIRGGSPGNRTLNLRIKSPLLCQLS
ncbi:hypothetical protein BH24ACT26_BH24ACT26_16790 [soil metagenome]